MNPLGIDIMRPRLSWQMQTDRQGACQTAYRILTASTVEGLKNGETVLWDSGKIESDQSVHVEYGGPRLASRQRVYWNVTVWDETGQASSSDTAWFEMGLLRRSDWRGKWIGAALTGGPRSTIPAPYLRKTFTLPSAVTSARLYVTALGLYECSINGQTVGDDVLNPGWTDFHKRVRYRVYDVTGLLDSGENVVGAVLGDGWAAGHIGWYDRQRYVDRPRLLVQMEMNLADGSTITIATDRTWKCQVGPLLENDLLMGEAYDARLEMPNWDSPGFDDKRWNPVVLFEDTGVALVATNGPTVRRINELKPIADPADRGNWHRKIAIFDMGQNMVGRIRFRGSAPAGTTVILRFAEMLNPDGTLYLTNLRTARATDCYTFKGDGEETWEPKFTFHGFRYVEVYGYPGKVGRDTIRGIVLHSDIAPTGDFDCSDPLINQLQHNIVWGQKGNFLDVPTDCPQRDERLGWTGDIQVFSRTAAFNMNVAGFLTKWMQDVADAQNEAGAVPEVVPSITKDKSDGGPAWADAAVIVPWTIYQAYGDKRILENTYEVMSKFMAFVLNVSPGYIRCAPEYEGWPGFGDWLSINANTPRDLIGTAFLAYDASLMMQIATVLGKKRDAAKYRKLFSDVKKAFQERYIKGHVRTIVSAAPSAMRRRVEDADATSRGNLKVVDYGPLTSKVFNTDVLTPTQTAYVLALHFDLLPDKLRPIAAAELVADIRRRNMHLSTGFVGSPYLPHVLSSNGQHDTACALLHQTTWPSWLYPVTQGATTIWERWDGWTPENGFQDPSMNSFNHYAYGSIGAWLYSTIAGIDIDPARPGYKHAILRPQPGGRLTHARGSLRTLYGELVSDWKIDKKGFYWTVVIPPNTTATLHVPVRDGQKIKLNGNAVSGADHEVSTGRYHVEAAGYR
jgi:alpha-L-rhamnosidase